MADIELDNLVKIYPFQPVKGLLHRRRQRALLAQQQSMPYVTNEGVVVLQKVSATIRQGEFVVLLGPSGCGKTTLLRLIAGLDEPTLGQIRFDGADVRGVPPEDRDVAMVFQSYSLYPHMTVLDNICFPLRTAHIPRRQLEEQAREMARLLDMEPWLNRLPGELSGGQQQRVLLARALCATRKMLLLDEPVSGLDPRVTAEMYGLIETLNREEGITVMMISHDISAALKYASHILHIGDSVFFGTKADYLQSPQGKVFDSGKGGEA